MVRVSSPTVLASRFINGTDCPVFLTGRAGTGKTTFLREVVRQTHKKCIVAAPTGIAAINAGGVTLHSLFQLPFGAFLPVDMPLQQLPMAIQLTTPRSLIRKLKLHANKRKLMNELELLIIDEVSMLRADLLDAIDAVLRSVRRQRNRPFGGVQLLFIGDLLQLPPVVKRDEWSVLQHHYQTMHFFQARALQAQPPIYIELEKIYRQSDPHFISLLNKVRENQVTADDARMLNAYCKPSFDPTQNEGYVFLTTHNAKAEALNRRALEKLGGRSHFFTARIDGDFGEHQYPMEYSLELKEGAQVMFIKNDYSGEARYFNGKIGTVDEMDDEGVVVRFADGSSPASVEPYSWENKTFSLNKESNEIEEKVKGTFTQFPIRLAWAITVHKSQGLTFEKAVIDVSAAFAPGQVYVALSRLRGLDGLVLSAPLPERSLVADPWLAGMSAQQTSDKDLKKRLEEESRQYLREQLVRTFDFGRLEDACRAHLATYTKEEGRSLRQHFKPWAEQLAIDVLPLKEVGQRFISQLTRTRSSDAAEELAFLQERVESAMAYFGPRLNAFSARVFAHIRELEGLSGVKKYKKELQELEGDFFARLKAINKAGALVKAVIEGRELKRQELNEGNLAPERNKMAEEAAESGKARSRGKTRGRIRKQKASKKTKDPAEPKVHTVDASFKLFQEGYSIEEIARLRSLAFTTVEGHLAECVADGRIGVERFLDKKKRAQILKASEAVGSTRLKDIMAVLGDEFSYGDVRFALAASSLKE
ncbi:MAG: helix-turn-helix domain-containing protein [Bacteroidales bacterium]